MIIEFQINFLLKIGKKLVEFEIPKTYRKNLEPSVSMGFYHNLDLIIIHWGRNDINNCGFFNDFYIF